MRPRQVQDFIPTPMSMAASMFYTGLDPETLQPVPCARSAKEKKMMKALVFYWDSEHWPLAREALKAAGRRDLIGRAPHCLVPPDYGATASAKPTNTSANAATPKVGSRPLIAGQAVKAPPPTSQTLSLEAADKTAITGPQLDVATRSASDVGSSVVLLSGVQPGSASVMSCPTSSKQSRNEASSSGQSLSCVGHESAGNRAWTAVTPAAQSKHWSTARSPLG